MHDGRVCRDRSSNQIGGVIHVQDNDLVLLADLFSDTNKLVRLHGQRIEAYVGRIDAQRLELLKCRHD
jgi:hypothetical protein